MDNLEKSLLEEMSGSTKEIVEVDPNIEPQDDPTSADPVVEEPAKSEEITAKEDGEEGEEDENPVTLLQKEFGLELEEIKEPTLQDIINVSKKAVEQVKEKYEKFEREDINKVADYLANGGTLEDYVATPQKTNNFTGRESIEEDNIKLQEVVVKYALEQQGLDEDEINIIIEDKKGKGKFADFANTKFTQLKTQEEEANAAIDAQISESAKKQQEDTEKYFKEIDGAFAEGFAGVTTDKTILEKSKGLHARDKRGVAGIGEVLNTLTPKEEAIINTFIIALKDKKDFAYTPTKKLATKAADKPIHSLIGAGNKAGATQKFASSSELEALLRG